MVAIVDGSTHIDDVKVLISEYLSSLGRDLSFQDISKELDNPLEKYSENTGKILVAIEEDNVLGMVAYYRISEHRCEMKRLYVRDAFRGRGIGEMLAIAIMRDVRLSGYKEIVLDTILPLKPAIALYRKLGFNECDPYYDNPMEDVLYFKKEL